MNRKKFNELKEEEKQAFEEFYAIHCRNDHRRELMGKITMRMELEEMDAYQACVTAGMAAAEVNDFLARRENQKEE